MPSPSIDLTGVQDDLTKLQDDEFVRNALEKGIDLVEYTRDLDTEIRRANDAAICKCASREGIGLVARPNLMHRCRRERPCRGFIRADRDLRRRPRSDGNHVSA